MEGALWKVESIEIEVLSIITYLIPYIQTVKMLGHTTDMDMVFLFLPDFSMKCIMGYFCCV